MPWVTPASTGPLYPGNRPPLMTSGLAALPVGAVKPQGWLKAQLTVQAKGLTGHLDEFWPDLRDSAWKGKGGDGWERGPYYLDGLVPLAWQLDDARLQGIAMAYMNWMLASGQPNGWFGPTKNKDRWPLAVALKVLTQFHDATGDARALTLIRNYFGYLKATPPDWPDREWRGVRAMENVVTAHWLYNRTADTVALEVAESIFRNSFDWTGYFRNFPYTTEQMREKVKHGHPTHVVNIAMAVKHPGIWFHQSGDEQFREAVYEGIASLDTHHGQAGGRFAGDEHLSGRRPTQGTELCAVVEYMFSLEKLIEVLGDARLADRLELLAYNANPGACTPDYWAHQYDQQANQVLCSQAKRKWSTNDDTSNLYGLEPNFGCCTANMHQGWPKLVAHLWMATTDKGLAAVAYGPCEVRAEVGPGIIATLTQKTDYPFDGDIEIVIDVPEPAAFPVLLRIPGWAEGAVLKARGKKHPAKAGTFARVERTWQRGDTIRLTLPMELRAERRYNNAVTLLRGPLVFSLKVGEDFRKLKSHHLGLPVIDWEVYPTTPWNYGLIMDPARPGTAVKVQTRKVSPVPFANDAAPVVLKVKGRAIPEWQMTENSAGETPKSPALSGEPITELELIPYGSTRLRITEFPLLGNKSR